MCGKVHRLMVFHYQSILTWTVPPTKLRDGWGTKRLQSQWTVATQEIIFQSVNREYLHQVIGAKEEIWIPFKLNKLFLEMVTRKSAGSWVGSHTGSTSWTWSVLSSCHYSFSWRSVVTSHSETVQTGTFDEWYEQFVTNCWLVNDRDSVDIDVIAESECLNGEIAAKITRCGRSIRVPTRYADWLLSLVDSHGACFLPMWYYYINQ